jgi:hypothetical protein
MTIVEKLDFIMAQIVEMRSSIDEINERLPEMESSCARMDSHIDLVESAINPCNVLKIPGAVKNYVLGLQPRPPPLSILSTPLPTL